VSLAAADFDITTDLVTIDDTKWAKDSELHTVVAGANPTASVGLSAVNGAASTYLRSDGAPALDQAIAPTMTGIWIYDTPDDADHTINGRVFIDDTVTQAEADAATLSSYAFLTVGGTNDVDFATPNTTLYGVKSEIRGSLVQDDDAQGIVAAFYDVTLSGAATGRDITSKARAGMHRLNVTGSNWTVSSAYAAEYQWLGGTGNTVTEGGMLQITSPSSANPAANWFGIRIADQNVAGTIEEALRIDVQTGGAAQGNVRFNGGNFDNGHLQFDDLHVWLDEAGQDLRAKIGTPTSDNDGAKLDVDDLTELNAATTANLMTLLSDEGAASTALMGDGTWVDVATQAEHDAEDECSEITGCVVSAITASSVDTLTNKSLDGDGTGNAIMIPDGASGIATATENIAIDDSNLGALSFWDGAARYLHAEQTKCLMIEDLAATDDDLNIFWTRRAITVQSISCTDTSGTTPTVSFTDNLGVAITPSPTCAATPTWSDVSADGDAALGANQGLEMDTGTAADAGSWVTVCFTYVFDAP